MKKLIILFSLLLGSSAFAQFGGGTYCSARTEDGNWAFRFNRGSIAENCAFVESGLRRISGAPIAEMKRGYWNVRGQNKVFTQCGFYENLITSTGAYALQNAFISAKGSGLSHCVFYVNSYW